jgi:hypothetical protein
MAGVTDLRSTGKPVSVTARSHRELKRRRIR